eukprot:6486285-Amphidinium_carterae.1
MAASNQGKTTGPFSKSGSPARKPGSSVPKAGEPRQCQSHHQQLPWPLLLQPWSSCWNVPCSCQGFGRKGGSGEEGTSCHRAAWGT